MGKQQGYSSNSSSVMEQIKKDKRNTTVKMYFWMLLTVSSSFLFVFLITTPVTDNPDAFVVEPDIRVTFVEGQDALDNEAVGGLGERKSFTGTALDEYMCWTQSAGLIHMRSEGGYEYSDVYINRDCPRIVIYSIFIHEYIHQMLYLEGIPNGEHHYYMDENRTTLMYPQVYWEMFKISTKIV